MPHNQPLSSTTSRLSEFAAVMRDTASSGVARGTGGAARSGTATIAFRASPLYSARPAAAPLRGVGIGW